jgi:hypothetical protein
VILVNSREGAEATRRRYVTGDGLESSVVRYFGLTPSAASRAPANVGALYPVAFRVEQDPETVSEPHFHQANQFQVFVEGDGFLGKTPVRPVTIQFAQAYTPYGPIVAGKNGVVYMTLRNGWDPGALYMPGAREQLKAFGKKPRHVVASTDAGSEVLIAPQEDGLGAWIRRIAPQASFTGPDPSSGGGQYWVCIAGEDVNPTNPMQRQSCAFLTPDEPARTATAGKGGLEVLVLQFPRMGYRE